MHRESNSVSATCLIVAVEFGISFSTNLLPSLQLQKLGIYLSLGLFGVYGLLLIHGQRQQAASVRTRKRRMVPTRRGDW